MTLVSGAFVSAQQDDSVSGCTEKLIVDRVNIGYDCGEFASVLITGNVVIQRPWSRVNRASRAQRIRTKRESGASGASASSVPPPSSTGATASAPVAASQNCHPAYRGCVPADHDVSSREIDYQHLQVFDVNVDPYNLDAVNKPGNGITCDDIGEIADSPYPTLRLLIL